MANYEWALNKSKLHRAIKHLQDNGKTVTEEAVKARYLETAGLLEADKPVIEKGGKYLKITRKK